ncbi:unnamed protein product [Ambrosiozyma monospora]|uniref:Unnamed protein product n=1 Tax=Ambrosiozyma monospora TaxID=43982 RepID=A0ACB5SZQ2_AMBMO|nr:unnamed protein product [Ambrosiozyma monospora]
MHFKVEFTYQAPIFPIIANSEELKCLFEVEFTTHLHPAVKQAGVELDLDVPLPFQLSFPKTVSSFGLEPDFYAYNWDAVTFTPLKNLQKLNIWGDPTSRKKTEIASFNLERIPSQLTQVNFMRAANRNLNGLSKLQRLSIVTTEKNFASSALDLRELSFGQLKKFTLELVNITFTAVTIKVPDLPVTLNKFLFVFIEKSVDLPATVPKQHEKTGETKHSIKVVASKLSSCVEKLSFYWSQKGACQTC